MSCSEFTPRLRTSWIPRSGMESSSLFFPIVRPSSWGTMLPERLSGLDPRLGGSRWATRSMRGRAIIGSAHSPNSLPSMKPTSR